MKQKNEQRYCVIMAGGIGARFWPLSKSNLPKQFIDVLGTGRSFLRATFERFLPVVPAKNFLVVTSALYKDLVLEHLPELRPEQVLCEPLRRNTAPCIAYAAYRIAAQCPEASMVVTPADHVVLGEVEFARIIEEGLDFAEQNEALLTIGIRPSRPETGYGYIQHDNQQADDVHRVKTFTEKPNKELAEAFIASGDFLWNSGMFLWSVPSILKAFETHLPQITNTFQRGIGIYNTPEEQSFINEVYPQSENISIDYGIMEKASNVFVRAGDFGWSDIGTWGSLYQNAEKDEYNNATGSCGNVLTYNTKGCVVSVPKGKIAVVEGLDDYLVVDKGDVLLVCRMSSEQSIRNYVDDVKSKFGEQYV